MIQDKTELVVMLSLYSLHFLTLAIFLISPLDRDGRLLGVVQYQASGGEEHRTRASCS
jgi:hypothetical protein